MEARLVGFGGRGVEVQIRRGSRVQGGWDLGAHGWRARQGRDGAGGLEVRGCPPRLRGWLCRRRSCGTSRSTRPRSSMFGFGKLDSELLQEEERAKKKKPSVYNEDQTLEWRGGLAQKRAKEEMAKAMQEEVRSHARRPRDESWAWGPARKAIDCRRRARGARGAEGQCGVGGWVGGRRSWPRSRRWSGCEGGASCEAGHRSQMLGCAAHCGRMLGCPEWWLAIGTLVGWPVRMRWMSGCQRVCRREQERLRTGCICTSHLDGCRGPAGAGCALCTARGGSAIKKWSRATHTPSLGLGVTPLPSSSCFSPRPPPSPLRTHPTNPTQPLQAAKPFSRSGPDAAHDDKMRHSVRFGDPFAALARKKAAAAGVLDDLLPMEGPEPAAITDAYDADKLEKSGELQPACVETPPPLHIPQTPKRITYPCMWHMPVHARARTRTRTHANTHARTHARPSPPPAAFLARRPALRLQGATGGAAAQLAQARRRGAAQPLLHPAGAPLGRRQPQQRL